MSTFDTIMELTAKLGEEYKDLKAQIQNNVKILNQDKGKALSDLNIFKSENEKLKGKTDELEKTSTTFKELSEALSKAGIEMSQIDQIAEKLKIKKERDDEITELKNLVAEQGKRIKDFEKEKESRTLIDALEPQLNVALKEFKDKDGNNVSIADDFIPRDELYKPIDLGNETLVNDRLTKVLEKAFAKQIDFQKRNNMVVQGNPVHDVGNGNRHYSGKGELNIEEIVKPVIDGHGKSDVAAIAIQQIFDANKNK